MTNDRVLTDSQQWVRAICDAFGWPEGLKAGYAAKFGKTLRDRVGATWQEFETHYGRFDPGVGVWWVYREVWPCKDKLQEPTPKIVENSWGRWQRATAIMLPVTVAPPAPAAYNSFLAWMQRKDEPDAARFAQVLATVYTSRPKEVPPLETIELYYRQCAFLPDDILTAAVEAVLGTKTYGIPQPGDILDAAVQVVMERDDMSEQWARVTVDDWRKAHRQQITGQRAQQMAQLTAAIGQGKTP